MGLLVEFSSLDEVGELTVVPGSENSQFSRTPLRMGVEVINGQSDARGSKRLRII